MKWEVFCSRRAVGFLQLATGLSSMVAGVAISRAFIKGTIAWHWGVAAAAVPLVLGMLYLAASERRIQVHRTRIAERNERLRVFECDE